MAAGQVSLRHDDGTVYGPWDAVLVNQVYWVENFVDPGQMSWGLSRVLVNRMCPILKPGWYTLLDSSPATWSQNSETGSRGVALIKGVIVP